MRCLGALFVFCSGRGIGAEEFNSGEKILAGGGCIAGRPNSGEDAMVGGDDLFGYFPPAENPYQEESDR